MEQLKEWLTPKDFAEEFGICKSTQAKMRMKKTLPYSKVGNFVRYSRTKIDQWLKEAEVA
jgi:excisionase family DNA binding protein